MVADYKQSILTYTRSIFGFDRVQRVGMRANRTTTHFSSSAWLGDEGGIPTLIIILQNDLNRTACTVRQERESGARISAFGLTQVG
jgi:hypothetical protein